MKRALFATVLSAILLSGTARAEEIKVQVIGQPAPQADANREIIELLKQVIQKLEAQGKKAPGAPAGIERRPAQGKWEVEAVPVQQAEAQKRLVAILNRQREKLGDVNKAREEVEQAKKRLQEAVEKLQKLEGRAAPGSPWRIEAKTEVKKPGTPAPTEEAKEKKRQELEKRLDQLMRELEAIRRELKK
jgi:hypothetical protein